MKLHHPAGTSPIQITEKPHCLDPISHLFTPSGWLQALENMPRCLLCATHPACCALTDEQGVFVLTTIQDVYYTLVDPVDDRGDAELISQRQRSMPSRS